MSSKDLVAFDSYGMIQVLDDALLDEVGAAGFIDINGICGSRIDGACQGSNAVCAASPNTVCGSNQVCDKF